MQQIKDFFEYCETINLVNQWVESYGKGEPEVSDQVYDREYLRIKLYEANNSDLIDPSSPTQNASDGNSDGFKKVDHKIPMVSIANSMSNEELESWVNKKLNDSCDEFTLEYKLDGLALALHYDGNGTLVEAVTRGQNGVGDSVLLNAYQIGNIPTQLDKSYEIRGEVVWLIDDFNAYNEQLVLEGKEPLSNPRNGAAGTMKQKDPMEVKNRKLAGSASIYGLTPVVLYAYKNMW